MREPWRTLLLVFTILMSLLFVKTCDAEAGQDFSVGTWGGIMNSAHSECDGDHCLDGKYLVGVTADYDVFDSEHFTFRTGVAYYNLTYDRSYRETAKHPRQDTTELTSDIFLGTAKGGVRLFDRVELFGILGYGNTMAFGYGASVDVGHGVSLDVESLNFDDNCDQFSAYVAGVRWSF